MSVELHGGQEQLLSEQSVERFITLNGPRKNTKYFWFIVPEEKLVVPKQNASSSEKKLSKVPNKINRHHKTKKLCGGERDLHDKGCHGIVTHTAS